jgi:hypothetical protein
VGPLGKKRLQPPLTRSTVSSLVAQVPAGSTVPPKTLVAGGPSTVSVRSRLATSKAGVRYPRIRPHVGFLRKSAGAVCGSVVTFPWGG